MSFNAVLFKDKSDLDEFVDVFPGCLTLGTYEKTNDTYPGVKILSVKSSKVGKTTLARFPDLEWVVCRSHGYDNVNLRDCQAKNVGVVTTSPTAENCARWCIDKIDVDSDLIILFGNGAIGSKVFGMIESKPVVLVTSRNSDLTSVVNAINSAERPTVIVTVPLNESTTKLFNKKWMNDIEVPIQIVSISRDDVFDDDSMFKFIEDGKLRSGHFDMLSPTIRTRIKSKYPFTDADVVYYGHSSWKFETGYAVENPVKTIVPVLLNNELIKLPPNSVKLSRW